MLAYQSCWLKYYYPAEFLCALLNNQPMGFYPPHVLINDAKRHRVRILSPDINESGVRCTVQRQRGSGRARICRGGRRGRATRIVLERTPMGRSARSPISSAGCRLRTEAIENLIMVGAFDRFGLGRREALWQVGLFIPSREFGGKNGKTPGGSSRWRCRSSRIWSSCGRWVPGSRWRAITPSSASRPAITRSACCARACRAPSAPCRELAHPGWRRIQVAGLIVCRQRPGTAKGITFLLLEDEHGLLNVIVFPDLYSERRHIVRGEPFVVIEGVLQQRNNTINLVAERIWPLSEARAEFHIPDNLDTPERQMPPTSTSSPSRARTPRPDSTTSARSPPHHTITDDISIRDG